MIIKINCYEKLAEVYHIFRELRPHLSDRDKFVKQIFDQQNEGYQVVGVQVKDEIVSCGGFRFITTLAWGKVLYIDDLITKNDMRGLGYGKMLLEYIIAVAKDQSCNAVHLDSGYGRHEAHKLYLKSGFEFSCHHLSLEINHK